MKFISYFVIAVICFCLLGFAYGSAESLLASLPQETNYAGGIATQMYHVPVGDMYLTDGEIRGYLLMLPIMSFVLGIFFVELLRHKTSR